MHRVIKADNALLTHDWETRALDSVPDEKKTTPIVKVIDFDSSTTTSTTLASGDKGHLLYIAPECREGASGVIIPEKGDVWRFGLFAYEVWTHSFLDKYDDDDAEGITESLIPSRADSAAAYALFQASPQDFRKAVMACWFKDPSKRPTFAELVASLTSVLTSNFPADTTAKVRIDRI